MFSSNIVALGESPITKESPAGFNTNATPEMDLIQDQIGRINNINGGREIDWGVVESTATELLTSHSKSFQVAAYWGVARLNNIGFVAVGEAATIISGISKRFWFCAWPPVNRIAGRIRAIEWWSDFVAEWLANHRNELFDKQVVLLVKERLEILICELDERGLNNSVLNSLVIKVAGLPANDIVISKQLSDSPVEPIKADINEELNDGLVSGAGVLASAPVLTAASYAKEDSKSQIKESLSNLITCSDAIFRDDISNGDSYRLRRVGCWSVLNKLPPAGGGRTKLEPPCPEDLDMVEHMWNNSNWGGLLKFCEIRVSQYIYWLDLSFYSYHALVSLGHGDAATVLKSEVVNIALRLPGFEKLAFSDGMPFASLETRDWIRETEREFSTEELNYKGSPLEECLQKAAFLARKGKVNKAMSLLQRSMLQSPNPEQLRIRNSMALIASEAGFHVVAMAHTEAVMQAVKDYRLEDWDPALALQLLNDAFTVFKSSGDERKALSVLTRISLLDSIEALNQSVNQSVNQ